MSTTMDKKIERVSEMFSKMRQQFRGCYFSMRHQNPTNLLTDWKLIVTRVRIHEGGCGSDEEVVASFDVPINDIKQVDQVLYNLIGV